MKRRFASRVGITTFVIASMLLFFTSCKKDKESDSPKTITDVVSTNSNFTLLKSAVVRANLATTLSSAGPFTVFAPNDNALNASGITSSVIAGLSADQLKNILLYHTLGSKVMAADVPAGPNAAVTTAGSGTLYVTKNSKGVFVNGWKVTTADIGASNGVIHTIEHVLMPPTGNLVEVAQANSNLTYLVAAVVRASEGSANVVQVLASAGPFTVFAPTNQPSLTRVFLQSLPSRLLTPIHLHPYLPIMYYLQEHSPLTWLMDKT